MALPKLVKDHGLAPEDFGYVTRLLGFPLPIDLHFSMFVTTIRGQGDDEQQAYWLPKAINFEIVGTYAQTEVRSGREARMDAPCKANLSGFRSSPSCAWRRRRRRWATGRSCAAWRRLPCTTSPRKSLSSTARPTRRSSGGRGTAAAARTGYFRRSPT